MKDAKIISILNVTLTEVKTNSMLLSKEVQSIESFGLCFGDRRYVCGARKPTVSRESSTSILYH
jgi:hypothetical protein